MKLRPLIRPIALGAALLGIAAVGFATRETWLPVVFPSRGEKDGAKPDEHAHEEADRIKLSEQAQRNLGLDSATLQPREYWRTIVIPGVVVDRPGESDRGVTSRVTGIVAEILAKPGDTVLPGATLFRLELVSEFLQTTQIELAKSATDLALATTERDRIANLVKLGTTPAADLTKQQNQVDRLTNLQRSLRRQLLLFGFAQEQVARAEGGEVVTEVTIHAPQSDSAGTLYEVKDLRVRLGDQVPAGLALCTLSDHSRLYVEGWAFKTEAKSLEVAAQKQVKIEVEFADETPADWKPIAPLTIHHLANAVDPVNRTFPFYLSLDNQSHAIVRDGKTYLAWRFRPGQRVRLRVPVEKLSTRGAGGAAVDPFVVSADAIVREGPETYVFVQAGDVFIRRGIRVLYQDRSEAVIANDGSITRAELIVKNQAGAINRALKAQASEGSGHDHEH